MADVPVARSFILQTGLRSIVNPARTREDFLPVGIKAHDHGAAADFAVVIDFSGHFSDPGEGHAEALETGRADHFVDFHEVFEAFCARNTVAGVGGFAISFEER